MIQTILSKVLEELKNEKPDLSYIRGMVEVLLAGEQNPIALQVPTYAPNHTHPNSSVTLFNTNAASTDPEANALDLIARSNLSLVKNGTTEE